MKCFAILGLSCLVPIFAHYNIGADNDSRVGRVTEFNDGVHVSVSILVDTTLYRENSKFKLSQKSAIKVKICLDQHDYSYDKIYLSQDSIISEELSQIYFD